MQYLRINTVDYQGNPLAKMCRMSNHEYREMLIREFKSMHINDKLNNIPICLYLHSVCRVKIYVCRIQVHCLVIVINCLYFFSKWMLNISTNCMPIRLEFPSQFQCTGVNMVYQRHQKYFVGFTKIKVYNAVLSPCLCISYYSDGPIQSVNTISRHCSFIFVQGCTLLYYLTYLSQV